MRDYLVRLLRPRWAVEAVGDGGAALASARAHPPDLVLSDVMMPGLGGFGLLRELRADPATSMVPVVLLSARAGEEAALEGLENGADDYLVKPFSARELLTRVRTHLEMARVRRRAAEAADHRLWLESILDLMPIPLILVEPGTARVTFANRAADRMAGGEFPRAKSADQYHEVYACTYQGARRVPDDEMPGVRAARGERLDGFLIDWHTPAGTFSLTVSSDTLHATQNHPATAVVVFQDVTRLRETEADLRRVVEAREQFLDVASHELKTPLTSLQLQLGAVERHTREITRDEASTEWLRARIAMMERQGDRLTRLINQLLDVSRITGERLWLHLDPVNLAEVVGEVIVRLQEGGAFARARCPVELRLSPDVSGRWDRARLDQILTHLVENALKFGAGKPVEIAASADLEAATLVVTDHGIGIPPEDQERIFGRFERAVSERHYGGLGLGLWIARRILDEMGGSITVRSEAGQGATFLVRLPLAGPAGMDDEHPTAAPEASAPATSGQSGGGARASLWRGREG
jgi:signal transduction histidine kinase/ActR/RegA family two-component response regulator